jgi:citrate lyase synthetase
LHKARELLLPLTANQMQDKHLIMRENNKGSTSILVPRIMMKEQMSAPISTSVVNEELKRRRRR